MKTIIEIRARRFERASGAANGAGLVAVVAALHTFSPPPPQLKYAAICFAVGLILFVAMHFLHGMVFMMANFDKPVRESVRDFLTKQGYAAMFWSAIFFIIGVGFGFVALLRLL
jgi:hypothetical protein